MTDRAALLANVLNDPADDTARLVLADWLEEHGEETFGRFVRAGVTAARLHAADALDDPTYYHALATATEVTLTGWPAVWLSELGIVPSPITPGDWVWDSDGDRITVRIGAESGAFTRGLLTELAVPLGRWYAVAQRALATWPLEGVRATDLPGLQFRIDSPAGERTDWRLVAEYTVPRRRSPRTRGGAPERWAAERAFADRGSLVQASRETCAELLDAVRAAAGTRWPQ